MNHIIHILLRIINKFVFIIKTIFHHQKCPRLNGETVTKKAVATTAERATRPCKNKQEFFSPFNHVQVV